MYSETRTELMTILEDDLLVDPLNVTDDSVLVGELGFDSVAFAIGAVAIEERLGVLLTAEQLLGCKTFGDVVRIIDGARASTNPVT